MSATHCPVCQEPKEKKWHLVCPYCWVKVPDADKEQVYALYQNERGLPTHIMKCRQVVRALCIAQREAAEPVRTAGSPADMIEVEDGCCPRCARHGDEVPLEYSERDDQDICPECGYSS